MSKATLVDMQPEEANAEETIENEGGIKEDYFHRLLFYSIYFSTSVLLN